MKIIFSYSYYNKNQLNTKNQSLEFCAHVKLCEMDHFVVISKYLLTLPFLVFTILLQFSHVQHPEALTTLKSVVSRRHLPSIFLQ